jgi:aryl-alcohol dehydrogenase-like predicted oxidoreductase
VAALAAAKDATPGQIALAWLLAQRPWTAPISGTRRREQLQENASATQVPLPADEVADSTPQQRGSACTATGTTTCT